MDWSLLYDMSPFILGAFGLLGWLVKHEFNEATLLKNIAGWTETANHNSTKALQQNTILKDALLASGIISLSDVRHWEDEV